MKAPEEIRRAAAEWVWFPHDSESIDAGVHLVRYPARLGGGVRASIVSSSGSAEDVIGFACAQSASWGESSITFWVGAEDSPSIEDELRRRGASQVDTVSILARPLEAPGVTVPDGVHPEIVRHRDQLLDLDAVNAAAWGEHPLDDAGLERELADIRSDLATATGARVLARIAGRAVSAGGCTLVDGFVRLWGAATIESARGRGAYRAVLAERLRYAAAHGATTALVKGRVSTSAPILERVGFERYGEERAYLLRLDE